MNLFHNCRLLSAAILMLVAGGVVCGQATGDPVEGVWRTTAGGAVFEVKAAPGLPGEYVMLVIDSSDYTVEPGTEFGRMSLTASPGVFDARMRISPSDKSVTNPFKEYRTVVIELTGEGRMTFKAYDKSRRISLRRLVPYLFRISVSERDTRPQGLDGAVRIDPPSPDAYPVVL